MAVLGGMDTQRTNAVLAGVFYIAATVAPISTLFFIGFLGGQIAASGPVPNYLVTLSASETQVVIGMFIEFIWALAVVGVPVVLFPVLKRQNEAAAFGFLGLRFVEAISTIVGSIILLTLLTLGQEFVRAGSPDGSYYQTVGTLLLSARDWSFMIGSGLVWSLSALVLNFVVYRSRLVPRWLSGWGLAGAALSLVAYLSQFFGFRLPELVFSPIAVQEMVFAVWLIVKGFGSPAIASEPA